nr:probable manganese-transporting ATPase PDR2 [Tanacetum cinerariifolium]
MSRIPYPALAYKPLHNMTVSEGRSLDREVVEGGLKFDGLAVFNCPIRGDSATVLSELKMSSHDLVQILQISQENAKPNKHGLENGKST